MNTSPSYKEMQVIAASRIFDSPGYKYDVFKLGEYMYLFSPLRAQGTFQLNYACKANSYIHLLFIAIRQGLDLVSPGETQLAFHFGFDRLKLSPSSSNLTKFIHRQYLLT